MAIIRDQGFCFAISSLEDNTVDACVFDILANRAGA